MKKLSLFLICFALTVCGFAETHAPSERLDDLRAKDLMYTAEIIDEAFVWKEKDVNGNNTAATIGSRGEGNIGANSAAIGNNNVAAGENSYAGGQNAVATNDNSFVWSGNTSGTNTYGSNGNGTFNVNPVGGLTGFYVGGTSLYDQISEMVVPTPTEEDFVIFYNTSFDEWPHTLNIVSNKNQFYELKEGSTYSEPFILKIPTTTPLKDVKVTIYIHQSPMRMFYYDIAPDNIENYPSKKIWLENESNKDAIWKFELESFPGCEDWTLMRYIQHETKAPYVWMTDGAGTITNISPSVNGTILIPASVNGETITTLDNNLFTQNSNLTFAKIEEGITTLGSSTFAECANLTGVSLPSTLETIGLRTFSECQSLETLEIPDAVSTIGAFAFFNSGIKTVDFTCKNKDDIQAITDYYWGLSNCLIHCADDEDIEIE